MSPGLVLAFWGTTFVLIAVPGPDWAFTLFSGVHDRVVFPAVAGLMLGYAALTLVVAAGVGVVVSRTPALLTILTLLGAAYVIWLGVSMLIRPGTLRTEPAADDAPHRPRWSRTLRGAGVSGLNPKGLLVFLALLPQFTDPRGDWPIPAQIGALGLVFVVTCGAFYSVVGLCARAVLRANPTASRALGRISGSAMTAVGIGLLVERAVAPTD